VQDTLATWGVIATGLLFVIFRKAAARQNEAFQRFLLQQTEPFDADTIQGYEIVIAILGALMVILGVLLLLGVLPPAS
jgi:hypothetical protein